uniref:C2H2-type domain-containing protein n=1 Tax=Salmo trutta TaxID=8032 RepID=A0A673W8Q4_SALTR
MTHSNAHGSGSHNSPIGEECQTPTLQIHMRTHTVENQSNPQCPLCGAEFSQKGLLDDHLVIAHSHEKPEKPYPCPDCGKRFSSKSIDLANRHSKSATYTLPV